MSSLPQKVSNSHSCEDILLDRVLSHIESGFYIDVGAYEPDIESITHIFYKKGWRGINVEPNPSAYNHLQECRPHDINLRVAVTDESGYSTFNIIEHTGLSTLSPSQAALSAGHIYTTTSISVPTTTLSMIWEKHVGPNQDVHFLKVDVEGAELQVIRGNSWDIFRPWIVIVEAITPISNTPSHEMWESILIDNDYKLVFFDGLNRFYLAKEKLELESAFAYPANVALDLFQPYMCQALRLELEEAFDLERIEFKNTQRRIEKEKSDLLIVHQELNGVLRALSNEVTAMKSAVDTQLKEQSQTLSQVLLRLAQKTAKPRPLWEFFVFKKNGKPRNIFRRALFHSSGKPRGVFKKYILKNDGNPHSPFGRWMYSDEYQQLPRAIRFYRSSDKISLNDLTPFARMVAKKIQEKLPVESKE